MSVESDAFRERFGVELPAAVVDAFHRGGAESKKFEVFSFEKVLALERLSWYVPLRFIPLMEGFRGDLVGLYYPRPGGVPFAACFGLLDVDPRFGDLVALTYDLERLFAESDYFDLRSPGRAEAMSRESLEITGLVFDPDSPRPARELLKPMALNYWSREGEKPGTLAALIERLSEDESSASRAAGFHFQKTIDLFSVEKWFAFSQSVAFPEGSDDTLLALENARATLAIPPHFGFPDHRKKPDSWCVDKELLYEMKELLATGAGDQLDRAVVERHCRYDWMKEADDAEEED